MSIEVRSPNWRIRSATRGAGPGSDQLPGLPREFLTDVSRVSDEVVVEPAPTTRGKAAAAGPIEVTVDVEPDQVPILAIRHPSGALTFHRPIESTTRGARGASQARFQVTVRSSGETRGIGAQAAKAIVVKVAKLAGDRIASALLPRLVELFEKRSWAKRGLKEGWLQVTREALLAGKLPPGAPVSPERSLLFIHGTFSNAVGGFQKLASTTFFDRVKDIYGDRIYAFDHFSLQRTPEDNVRLLLEGLPEHTTTFDVVTHSRGGLVLRTLVERGRTFGALSKRFTLGRAVLVAAPNNGTPLATPDRWDHTVGWIANLLELFPDNPFTIGAEFVANGLVWFANHASGDIPGLHAMDGDAEPIRQLQSADDPPPDAYSALVSNYNPVGAMLRRLLDAGLDQFFGSANDLVVPSAGGWSVLRGNKCLVPSSRIGCFGPGGNLADDSVTHVNFFAHQETADFMVTALEGRTQALGNIDQRRPLPDRRFARGIPAAAAPSAPAAGPPPTAARVARAARSRRPSAPPAEGAATSLRITVMNADLSFIPDALLLGHYASSELTGTEAVMNRLVGGTMGYSLQLGVYPLVPGSHQLFVNRHVDRERGTLVPRPTAVIVVGLGPEGVLQAADLVKTIRLAVIDWAGHLAQANRAAATFELASTLLASGGSGISAGQSAQLIAQGVLEANALLARVGGQETNNWPRCSHLRLVELYLDRAAEAWRALQLQQHVATADGFVLTPTVEVGKGGHLRPPDSGYRGAPYDFITVETSTTDHGVQTFDYNLDTRRARSEVRGKSAQTKLLSQLVSTASNDENRDPRIGVTLANLLVPLEFDSYLASAPGIQMSLDRQSAAIPWELLDITRSGDSDERPWAVRVKLLRKLKLERFRERVVDAKAEDNILVIGEPECPPEFPRLEGARLEAIRVHDVLKASGVDASKLTLIAGDTPAAPRPDAQGIVDALFEKPWRIVHIAGHGDPGTGGAGGVVLSNGTFLSPDEITSMRVVPELVFVNCCYLGRVGEIRSARREYNRAEFASSVAGALINIGVRCVVAAGWAVDDDAAGEFAATFYESLLRGERFIDAVGAARQAAWENHRGVNTWAAYQCYGDPDWRYRPKAPDANRPSVDLREFSGIATDEALRLEVDRIFVTTRFQHADRAVQVGKLQALEQQFGDVWGHQGNVAESFGRAFAEAGALDRAMAWYERAVGAADGSASMEALGQLGNAQSRFAWELVEKAVRHRDRMRQHVESVGAARPAPTRTARAAARAALADAQRRLADAIAAARPLLVASLDTLRPLAEQTPTMERRSLVASAIKRRAMVNTAAGQIAQTRRDVVDMRAAYADALRIGKTQKDADLYYPASNCLAADLVLGARKRTVALDRAVVSLVKKELEGRAGANANFWSEATAIELQQYEAIAARRLARELNRLKARYQQLFDRATSIRMWASVYDNAYLVLAGYGQQASARERDAAATLLTMIRGFAHPNE